MEIERDERYANVTSQAGPQDPASRVWEDGDGIRYTGGADITVVPVPGVLKYLDVELAAMGVGMRFKVGP